MVFRIFLAAVLAAGLASAQGKKGAGNNTMGDMSMPRQANRVRRIRHPRYSMRRRKPPDR